MLLLYLLIVGLAIGSFLNVLIDRLPKGEGIFGRSYCDHCKKKIKGYDLIPVLSFIFLGGKCRFCNKKISFQYPLVEFLTGVLFAFAWLYLPVDNILKVLYLGIISSLIVVFFADFKYQIIPDEIQMTLFIFVLLGLFLTGGTSLVLKRFLDGLLIMLPLLAVFLLTKRKGMGFGDVKLGFILGYLLGWVPGFMALYIAFLTGAIVGLIEILLKRKKIRSKIAFGPFLALGTIVMIFFGDPVSNFLAKLFGF